MMISRRIPMSRLFGWLCLAVAVTLPATARAQTRLLDISVHVQGQKQYNANLEPPLRNARVTLTNLRTGQVWSNLTDVNGQTLFLRVPLGPYRVRAQYPRDQGVWQEQRTGEAVSVVRFYLPVKK